MSKQNNKSQYSIRENRCADCLYFDKFVAQKREDNVIGACKANPPSPAGDYSESKLGVWPLVLGTFWCGLFEKKGEKE